MNDFCSLLGQNDEREYQRFIEENPSPFEYTLAWRKIMETHFGFKSFHIICKKEGQICGALPLFKAKGFFGTRLVSTPYATYTGILADNEETKKSIIDFSKHLVKKEKVNFLEIREQTENINFDLKMKKKVFNFSLKLSDDYSRVWKTLPKGSVRWGIKKAIRNGLTWEVGNSEKDLDQFYKLFLQTRKFRGVPGYPYKYLKEILNSFDVKIYTTKLKEKAIASIFLIYYKKEVRYAFGGALHDRELMKMQPYHLILWEAIKDACLNDYAIFNFGGSSLSANEGGLYGFKKKWADEIIELPYYYILNKLEKIPDEGPVFFLNLGAAAWKKLPTPLVRFLSPKIIKRFV
jgi:FemAB-related protein (PEP-CTERM system-associated)